MGSVKGLLLFLLVLWMSEPMAEGCSCLPGHLQQLFCYSDVVIRAKVVGQKVISESYRPYEMGTIEYKVKLIKMFKGFDKVDSIKYVYTVVEESMCGVKLDAKNKVQYLLSGKIMEGGNVEVILCNIHAPWDTLTLAQKKNLHRYPKGCDCTISSCSKRHCRPTSENECAWSPYISQTHFGACVKHANGTCSWLKDKPDVFTLHNARKRGAKKTSVLAQA